ncbi:MAG: ABC transporter permease [Bacillati bacterium]
MVRCLELAARPMIAYAARRILGSIPLLLVITIISYALMGLSPGGPAAILGQSARGMTPIQREHLIALLGLNRPWYVQYFYWLQNLVLHGSLGYSYVDSRPVIAKILGKLPVTLELIGLSTLLTLAIAIPTGVYAAVKRGRAFDEIVTTLAFVAYGMPVFWLGILLIDVFAVHLRWFPLSGISSLGQSHNLLDRLDHLVLPVVTLSTVSFASWMRYQRSATIEVLGAPFVRTAHAKGLTNWTVIVKHTLRNALLPTITLLGLSLPSLIGGAYFIEYVFSLPGMGYLGVTSIFARDYPTVMGITLISAVLVVVGNLLADIAYAAVDPRIRYD